jgi:hypothetical protein
MLSRSLHFGSSSNVEICLSGMTLPKSTHPLGLVDLNCLTNGSGREVIHGSHEALLEYGDLSLFSLHKPKSRIFIHDRYIYMAILVIVNIPPTIAVLALDKFICSWITVFAESDIIVCPERVIYRGC